MKKTLKLIALSCIVVLSLSSFAKDQAGVYMTANDFVNKKITYGTDCKVHPNNSVANLPYITVTDHGRKHKLEKNKIFGYVDCNNKAYRFYQNEEFLIAEGGNVIIYIQPEHIDHITSAQKPMERSSH
jgi:hypothetical protein